MACHRPFHFVNIHSHKIGMNKSDWNTEHTLAFVSTVLHIVFTCMLVDQVWSIYILD